MSPLLFVSFLPNFSCLVKSNQAARFHIHRTYYKYPPIILNSRLKDLTFSFLDGHLNGFFFSTVSDLNPLLSHNPILTRLSTLSTLSALPSPTSLQVAAVAYSLYNGTRLVRNGCAQGDGSKNCTAACQNMTQVFTSMDTFQNCLAFPTINNILSTANTTNEYRELAREYGITGEDPNSSFGVVNQITSCLASYCSDSSKCYAFGQQPYQAVGSDMSCSYLQDLNRFPISLLYFPYDRHILFESCDANAATVYIGDDGRSAWYGKESNGRQAYCDTSSTINGTSTPRARLNIYNGTLACIQSICGGVHQAATVDSEIGGIGVWCRNQNVRSILLTFRDRYISHTFCKQALL